MKELFAKKIGRIHSDLMSCYHDTEKYSPSIIGEEREIFNRILFQKILPSSYRIGAGSIVDSVGHETGQIDTVIELPNSLSFPISSGDNRLYLADAIGATFEIKSNLNKQWGEAIKKIEEIKTINRINIDENKYNELDSLKIPAFIISFTGQKSLETLYQKLENIKPIYWPDGILIIESGIFLGRAAGCDHVYEATSNTGAILAFISCLYKVLNRYSLNFIDLDGYKGLL